VMVGARLGVDCFGVRKYESKPSHTNNLLMTNRRSDVSDANQPVETHLPVELESCPIFLQMQEICR